MTSFNKVAVVSKLPVTRNFKECNEIIDLLIEKYNLDIYVNEDYAKKIGFNKSVKLEQLKEFDLIIALGGDGTILLAARHAQEVPLFGINAGHLGFLTSATLEGGPSGLDRIMNGDYELERCMRLEASINGKKLSTALNEVYTTNKLSAHICHLNLKVNDFQYGEHLLDGFLVSTPVGSTAYAMSAGGSIIEYSLKAMQMVPVNSVSRRIRPFVVPGDYKIQITVAKEFDEDIIVLCDGIYESKLDKNSVLEITRSNIETVFVRFPDFGFFNRLQSKLDF